VCLISPDTAAMSVKACEQQDPLSIVMQVGHRGLATELQRTSESFQDHYTSSAVAILAALLITLTSN
jgi:hypothetical protein